MSEEQMNDSTFGRLFILMIIAMMVLTAIIIALAVLVPKDVNDKLDLQTNSENSDALAKRIAPVGTFSITSNEEEPTTSITEVVLSGEEAYTNCAACHASGVLGAPKLTDKEAWVDRIAKGEEVLYSNAINGIGNMTAKGGNLALSDESVKAAVDYMLQTLQEE